MVKKIGTLESVMAGVGVLVKEEEEEEEEEEER